jgi:hypothetical protein
MNNIGCINHRVSCLEKYMVQLSATRFNVDIVVYQIGITTTVVQKSCNVAIAICIKTKSLIICQCFLLLFIGIQYHAEIYEISSLALTSDPASSLHFFVRQDLLYEFKYKCSTRELLQSFNSPAFSFGSPKYLSKKPQQNRFQTEVLP